jgi:hypothetical protein
VTLPEWRGAEKNVKSKCDASLVTQYWKKRDIKLWRLPCVKYRKI